MIEKEKIVKMLSKMTNDNHENLKEILKVFGDLYYRDSEDQTILHILVDDLYNEEECFKALKTLLLYTSISPNVEDDYEYIFIQTALYTGYSERFILKIIELALKRELAVNHVDSDFDTIMHTVIYSDDYHGEVINIYNLLCQNGFDSSRRDGLNRNIYEAAVYEGKLTHIQLQQLKDDFDKKTNQKEEQISQDNNLCKKITIKDIRISSQDYSELKKLGYILNEKEYLNNPTVGRENELKKLMISLAQEKSSPLLIGESGVGKTVLVEELVYQIINEQVPTFLKDKIIFEVNSSELVAGTKYSGTFEDKIKKIIDLCIKYDMILFIDEIHTIYGAGTHDKSDVDLAAMLKFDIDRKNIKVIGTTTDSEYNQYFANDALKRRFNVIKIKEPDESMLYEIIKKVIEDYSLKNSIYFKDENVKNKIIDILIGITRPKYRNYNDKLNNPALSILLIDLAFAICKYYDSLFITEEHFIESIECCDRIYDSIKIQAKQKLMNNEETKYLGKILRPNFN